MCVALRGRYRGRGELAAGALEDGPLWRDSPRRAGAPVTPPAHGGNSPGPGRWAVVGGGPSGPGRQLARWGELVGCCGRDGGGEEERVREAARA